MGYVDGFAYQKPVAAKEHSDAYVRVKHIADAVLRTEYEKGRNVVHLDPAKTDGLSDLEKLVLADTPALGPFGGRVEGSTVTVYTD